jgi:hypothetical protein
MSRLFKAEKLQPFIDEASALMAQLFEQYGRECIEAAAKEAEEAIRTLYDGSPYEVVAAIREMPLP